MKKKELFYLLPLLPILGGCKTKIVEEDIKPNIVFIYADDLGKGMLSYYGQKQFNTPNIDRLFEQGVRFERAYGCHYSAPARASMLTGYHDCRTDKWRINNGGAFIVKDTSLIAAKEMLLNTKDVRLPEAEDYLAEVFQHAGYVTGQVGKLDYGFTATREQLRYHGWDYFYGYMDHQRCHGFYPPFLFENDKIELVDGNTSVHCATEKEGNPEKYYEERWNMEGKKIYSQTLFLKKILAFIRSNKETPFFLFHPTQLPHGPVSVPMVDPAVKNNETLTQIEKEYASMVLLLDKQVGVILKELEELGLAERTIVIFAADNGHEIYYSKPGRVLKPYRNMKTGKRVDDYTVKFYSDSCGDVFNGNAGMAGLKRSNLDGGTHIPLTYYWPGHYASKSCHQLVAGYDLLPTLAEVIKQPFCGDKDGRSYAKMLIGKDTFPSNRVVLYNSIYGPAIVRNDGWKLRYYRRKKCFELYHLLKDPKEKKEISTVYPEVKEELKKILSNWR